MNFLKLCAIIFIGFIAGCSKPDDAVSETGSDDTQESVEAPGIQEVKDIAEEGVIFGLPIVMNYAVMYEYAVDKGGSQFKAPFNQLKNEPRVYTYKDTAVLTFVKPITKISSTT